MPVGEKEAARVPFRTAATLSEEYYLNFVCGICFEAAVKILKTSLL